MPKIHIYVSTKYRKEHMVNLKSAYKDYIPEPYFPVLLQSSACDFCSLLVFNMDAQCTFTRALKSLQEQDRRWRRNKRDRARLRQRQRNKRAKGWESGGKGIVPGTLLKLAVKDKPQYSERVPVIMLQCEVQRTVCTATTPTVSTVFR